MAITFFKSKTQRVSGSDLTGDNTQSPVSLFFKKHLENAKDTRSNLKEAIRIRNQEGQTEYSAKVKYPAALLTAGRVSNAMTLLVTGLVTALTAWGDTTKSIVSSVGGGYVGDVIGLVAAWVFFNAGRVKRDGLRKLVKEGFTFVLRGFAGVAIEWEKKLDEKVKAGKKVSSIRRWAARIVGTAISPAPLVYTSMLLGVTTLANAGSGAVMAVVGGFAIKTLYFSYAVGMNFKMVSDIDKRRKGIDD